MRRPSTPIASAAFLSLATLAACGGGGSQLPANAPRPSPTPVVSPTPSRTGTPAPTAMPTSGIVPTAACDVAAEPLPGTYVSLATFGNVSGSAYTQSPGANSGAWAATEYATPVPSPVPSPTPTIPPTPTPSASPVNYVEYSGDYEMAGFEGRGSTGPYATSATTGCFLLVVTQNGAPVAPGDPFNSYAIGFPGFDSPTGVTATTIARGNITRLSVANLTPGSGNGTFVLDNDATGTITITGSQIVSFGRVRRIRDALEP